MENKIINKNNIWVEKYRPKKIKDIIQQEDIKKMIENIDDIKKLPHMLFYGQPGTGKTTAAINICRHIFGYNNFDNFTKQKTNLLNEKIYKERVLELNASDERGIKIVRDKIKNFAALAINEYINIPNYKIIILDEADAMTNDSQFALRRIIEEYSSITRFILICNYVTKIIAPLSSRCTNFKFNNISYINMLNMIEKILINENIEYEIEELNRIMNYLYEITNGDMRKCITYIQRACYIFNNDNNSEKLLLKHVIMINSDPEKSIIEKYMNNILLIEDIKIIYDKTNNLINLGYPILSVINLIKKIILKIDTNYDLNINDDIEKNNILLKKIIINDQMKSNIFVKIADITNLLNTGSTDLIQLLCLIMHIRYIIYN
jgi:replication factor C subunit 2/4